MIYVYVAVTVLQNYSICN